LNQQQVEPPLSPVSPVAPQVSSATSTNPVQAPQQNPPQQAADTQQQQTGAAISAPSVAQANPSLALGNQKGDATEAKIDIEDDNAESDLSTTSNSTNTEDLARQLLQLQPDVELNELQDGESAGDTKSILSNDTPRDKDVSQENIDTVEKPVVNSSASTGAPPESEKKGRWQRFKDYIFSFEWIRNFFNLFGTPK